MNKWKFSETKFIEEQSFNKVLEQFYSYGISGLVRENIQNSLDHRLDPSLPVMVNIEIGVINKKHIPGFEEIKERINSLKAGNLYVSETLENMKSNIYENDFNYITFEDTNTKGLSGSKYGQTHNSEYSYSAYAYSKGVHHEDSDKYSEKLRGGSHGVGKIASNAASTFYTMFFANCDEENNKTLGGTIQLFDHCVKDKCYRATGYFTDEANGIYFPYQNNGFHDIFQKETRGLKIIIPFLREQFADKNQIIRTICDNFMLAILNSDLIVTLNDETINEYSFENLLNDEEYFPNNEEFEREFFTKLYFNTYKNLYSDSFLIEDKHKSYRFKLYFTYDENILIGRTGIFRSIGMKIDDMLIKSYGSKPYNALLLPFSGDEDEFLKSLENESHTKLDYKNIKNLDVQNNAKRFINNVHRKVALVIEEAININNPSEGVMDTSDIIYEVENTFKRDLQKHMTELNFGSGTNKKTIIKVNDTDELGETTKNNKTTRKKPNKITKIKKEFGNNGTKEYYQIPGSIVKRYIDQYNEIEMLQINLQDQLISEDVKSGNLLVTLVDGMGIEYPDEFDLTKNYIQILDKNAKTKLPYTKNCIRSVNFENNSILLKLQTKNRNNRIAKLRYYLEV